MNKELEQKYIQARGRGNVAINTVKQVLKNRLAEVEKYHTDFGAAGPADAAKILSWMLNDVTVNLDLNLVALANAQSDMATVAHFYEKEPKVREIIWTVKSDAMGLFYEGVLNDMVVAHVSPEVMGEGPWKVTNSGMYFNSKLYADPQELMDLVSEGINAFLDRFK